MTRNNSLRIQKIGELKPTPEDIEGELDLRSGSGSWGNKVEECLELLSAIINELRETFGSGLTDEDRLHLNNACKRLSENEILQKVMQGDSSETNKASTGTK